MIPASSEGKTLKICDKTIDLPQEVDTIVQGRGLVIVLLDVMAKDDLLNNRNVWAFDKSGEKVWEIEEEPLRLSPDDKQFIHLWEDDGELWTRTWHSHEFRVDWETGELLEKRHTR